jgi:multidrug efflux pump subunit AcrB
MYFVPLVQFEPFLDRVEAGRVRLRPILMTTAAWWQA